MSSFSRLLRDVRALYYDDFVAGTCILLNPFCGAVIGNTCIFGYLFQKLTNCKESGIFTDVFINFTGLLEKYYNLCHQSTMLISVLLPVGGLFDYTAPRLFK